MAKEDKTLGILTHVLGLFTGFIGPLIIFLIADDKKTKDHSKLALNWQFSLLIYMIVSFVLIFVLIGILLIIALGIMNLIFSIMAAVKASNGEKWKYPLAIPFFDV
jgi:uncharacterized protein